MASLEAGADGSDVALHPAPLPPEEQARSDFYALLARLYSGGPDAELLSALARSGDMVPVESPGSVNDGGMASQLAAAWKALTDASGTTDAAAATLEYDDLFVGVGKSELNLHASHWLTGFMMEKPLAEVRATLAGLGLGRQERATLVEDHLAALCETMRILVSGGAGRPPAGLAEQRAFFELHIAPWVDLCCGAIVNSPVANYYRKVAQFTQCYFALERESLAME